MLAVMLPGNPCLTSVLYCTLRFITDASGNSEERQNCTTVWWRADGYELETDYGESSSLEHHGRHSEDEELR